MKEWFSIFSISSFIWIHLSYPQTNLHLTPYGCLSSPQAISGVCDLSETFPSASLCPPVHPLFLCVPSLLLQSGDRVGAVWKAGMHRERLELGCWRRAGRRGRQARGIFPWMRSWMMASLRARAELVADAPLTSLYQQIHAHMHAYAQTYTHPGNNI